MVRAVTAPMFAASVQDLFHPRVGIERLALDDADGGKETQRGRIASVGRLFLDDLVQQIPESVVAGGDEVGRHAGAIDELHRGRIGRIGELIDLQMASSPTRHRAWSSRRRRKDGTPASCRRCSAARRNSLRGLAPCSRAAVRDTCRLCPGPAPVMPTSATQRYQKSLISPRPWAEPPRPAGLCGCQPR